VDEDRFEDPPLCRGELDPDRAAVPEEAGGFDEESPGPAGIPGEVPEPDTMALRYPPS
jgi:hypothetical protein